MMTHKEKRVLVVAAHPDDEILGCGGTVAKWSKQGAEVMHLILGEGITSRYAKREDAPAKELQKLHACASKAGKIVGAKKVIVENFPDNRFDSVDLIEIIKVIEQTVREFKPNIVFTQHGGDLNIDHVMTYRAVLTAARPFFTSLIRKLYAYPVASSTDCAFQSFSPIFRPHYFVDIEKTVQTKIKAMETYEIEARKFPHPRSPQALLAASQYWGSIVGMSAAEAFEIIYDLE